jgi:phage baseplate assembly protein W
MARKIIGFNPPFFGGNSNIMSPQEEERLIKNDLIQLILTFPGERVFRPDFGTITRGKVFDMNTSVDLSLLRENIIEAIEEFEPRVSLTDVIIEDDGVASIIIKIFGTLNIERSESRQEDQNNLLVELNLNDRAA